MITAFKEHIRQKSLLDENFSYLFACSGGIDSMVLGDLLLKSDIQFEVAHVNFGLRSHESEGDEEFVKKWAEKNQLRLHTHHADAMEVAEEKKISIQMAAREIRYAWFEKLNTERKLSGIILAHQEDDQLETIFLNLLRGTGMEGIQGMADRKGSLIRPLLPFSRAEIENYAKENGINWREDSSNLKTDYKRNKLRLEALPALYEVASDARKNILGSFVRLKDSAKAFNHLFENWKKDQIRVDGDYQFLPFHAIQNTPGAVSLVFHWLKPFGFNSDQAEGIVDACSNPQAGKIFETGAYQASIDREEVILSPKHQNFDPIEINRDDIGLTIKEDRYELIKMDTGSRMDTLRENAMLDFEKLDFPLEIRSWELGDRFIPLGMKNSKKISDFLIDLKVSLAEKSKVKVLISNGKIAWVIGYRIADWAKCDASTRKIYYIKHLS